MKNYYNILGIKQDASHEEIRTIYRNLARQYHPDLHKDNPIFYEEKMKELNEAAEILLNKEKRKDYDNSLLAEQEKLRQKIEYKSKPMTNQHKQHSDNSIKAMIVYFSILALISIFVILFGLYICFIEPSQKAKTKTPEYLDFGLSKKEVILLLGEPIKETKHLMVYDDYQIIIRLNEVDGWLDANNILDVGEQKEININDIKTGMSIVNIINKYGNPDTYSNELAIYDNIVLYLNDSLIQKIEILDKKRG